MIGKCWKTVGKCLEIDWKMVGKWPTIIPKRSQNYPTMIPKWWQHDATNDEKRMQKIMQNMMQVLHGVLCLPFLWLGILFLVKSMRKTNQQYLLWTDCWTKKRAPLVTRPVVYTKNYHTKQHRMWSRAFYLLTCYRHKGHYPPVLFSFSATSSYSASFPPISTVNMNIH